MTSHEEIPADSVFVQEAYSLLSELNDQLLALETAEAPLPLINDIFVSLHTIKGSASMDGFEEIAEFTHEAESAFDLIRSEKREVNEGFLVLANECLDHIRLLFDLRTSKDVVKRYTTDIKSKTDGIMAHLNLFVNGPRAEQQEVGRSDSPPAEAAAGSGSAKTFRVLIVEDEFSIRNIFPRLLQTLIKCSCDIAIDGAEAIEAVRDALTGDRHYDIIFLDIEMPRLTGQEALKSIRKQEADSGLPPARCAKIFMTTGRTDKQNVLTAFREQVDGYIVKPVTKEKLLNQFREANLSLSS